MKKLIIVAVFAIFSASSAMSASLTDITPSVGISFNNAAFAGEGNSRENNETGSVDVTTDEYGAFAETYGSIFLEAGFGDVISLGIEYVPSGISSPTNTSRENEGSNSSVSADFEDLTTVYAKINVPLGGTYLKFGFSQVDVVINDKMASGNTYKDVDTEGYTAGIGYAHEISNGFSIRGEVMASQFDDVQTDNGVAATGNRNVVQVESMWGAKGTVSLVKSF
ncbi:porin family protein [Candidatus Pelagibacter sp.]|nr:porin family protein [Candidatus Pelagibacter sp.]